MALHTSNFKTFADVEHWYNTTKPVRGAKCKGLDIRPIGDRHRKWERIVKISDDCYALSDGYHYGDIQMFNQWGKDYTATPNDMAFYAPIVWRRLGQGIETVTIRNGSGPWQHNSRYQFLTHNLPAGLSFHIQNGKHFIGRWGTSEQVYLAKGNTVPVAVYDEAQKRKAAGTSSVWSSSVWSTLPWAMTSDDKASLTFRRIADAGNYAVSWELISGNGVAPIPPRKVVDKEAKALMKGAIRGFCDWAMIMTRMLDVTNYAVRQGYSNQTADWMKENGDHGVYRAWGPFKQRVPSALAREIVQDENHPLRLAMAVSMVYETEVYTRSLSSADSMAQARTRLNRWINSALNFITTVQD